MSKKEEGKKCSICGYTYKTGIAGYQGGLYANDVRLHDSSHREIKN